MPTPSPLGYLNDRDNDRAGDSDNDNNQDNDNDNPEDHKVSDNTSYHESDDDPIVAWGHPASTADKQAIAALVKHYYAIAAMGDGVKACSMLLSGLARTVVEDYGHGSAGPPYLSAGKTCPAVLHLLFEHLRAQATATVEVTDVRIDGNQAFALIGSRTSPASFISLQRQHGAWLIGQMIGSALP